jgi:hypothetical protein
MSSSVVRTAIKDFLATSAPSETVVDISSQYAEFNEMLTEADVQPDAPWLGIEFIGDDEIPVSLAATNDQGLYREIGSIILHVCAEAKLGVGDSILARGEVLRNLFRGLRIDSIVIEGVTPVNFGAGSTLSFDGGYVSGSITVSYHRDNNLGA